jgi:lipopolysaccharide biosynthesis glycosyltransferase
MNERGRTVIVTTTDRGYLPAACCQLKSSWDHLERKENTELYLAVCDVSQEDIAESRRYFDMRGVNAKVLECDEIADQIKPIGNRWPRAAYLRLYFDSLFDASVERLVYFDADTRVCTSLEPLINADLRGAPIGAVHDFIYYVTGNIRRRRRDLFLAADAPYLQSGVMVFDWPKTLENGGFARARQFLADHPERCQEAPDQDALNVAFEGQWTPIDPRWNLHEFYLMFGGTLKPYIEHYTSTKPWSRLRPPAWRDAAEWYKRELADTKWNDFIQPQSQMDIAKAHLAFMKFRYAGKVRDGLASHAPIVLDLLGKPRQRPEDQELPWAPRNRNDVETMTHALIREASQQCPRLLPPESVLSS